MRRAGVFAKHEKTIKNRYAGEYLFIARMF
jgi:hypothetical protein